MKSTGVLYVLVMWLLAMSSSAQGFELKNSRSGWALGGVTYVLDDPLVGDERTLGLSPALIYEGEKLFIRGGMLGYRLLRSQNWEFSVYTQATAELPDRDENDLLKDMADRDPAQEAGLRLESIRDWGKVHFRLQSDISDTHDGWRAELEYESPVQLRGGGEFFPVVGLRYRSRELINYYYGVPASEAKADRPEYQSDSQLGSYLGFQYSYPMTTKWTLLTALELEFHDEAITDSPIVESKRNTAFAFGAVYYFD